MPTELASVDVEEGFYPRFAESFRQHYGPESAFVHAVADSFTIALSRLLDARGMLADGAVVPILGVEEAGRAVGRLVRAAPSIRDTLLQEAFGAVPIGTYAVALDGILGASFFTRWLAAIQAGDYDTANQLLLNEQEPGSATSETN